MSDSRRAVVLDWTRGYPKEWLRPDLVAGLTAAAVEIPKAMAYATIAGVPRLSPFILRDQPYNRHLSYPYRAYNSQEIWSWVKEQIEDWRSQNA